MLTLLKIEWKKLKPYRNFWIQLIFSAIAVFGLNFIVYNFMHKNLPPKEGTLIMDSPFGFPEVWHTVTYLSGFLLYLPGVLIITLVTNEFSFRTHRQNIIDGIKRNQFIWIKYTVLFFISIFFTLVVSACTIFFGTLSGTASSAEKLIYLFYFLLQCLSYCSVAMLFGILLKKTGMAIALFLAYGLVLERFLSSLLNMGSGKFYLGNYLPLTSADRLILFPFAKDLSKQFLAIVNIPTMLATVLIYLLIYYYVINKHFKNADL